VRNCVAPLACVMLCVTFALADDKKEAKKSAPTAQAIRVSVHRKVDEKLAEQFLLGKFGSGTEVELLVRCPDRPLLGPEKWNKLTVEDDKGNVLNDPKDLSRVNFLILTQVSFDRAAMAFAVPTEGLPGKGAKKLLLRGELVVLCGTEEKSVEAKKFDFAEGTTAKAGDFQVKVVRNKGLYRDNGKYRTGSSQLRVSTDAFTRDVVKGVVVKDADGETLDVAQPGVGVRVPFDTSSDFVLTKPVKQGTVVVTYFAKSEQFEVPIDLSIGLGE